MKVAHLYIVICMAGFSQALCDEALPTSVTWVAAADNTHTLTISGIHSVDPYASLDVKQVFVSRPVDFWSIPKQISGTIDHEKQVCRITTSGKLSAAELADAINELSKLRTDIPCWAELKARDLEKSPDFHDDNYTIVSTDSGEVSNAAWYYHFRWGGFSIPFRHFGDPSNGSFMITSTTSDEKPCYVLRALDSKKRILWSHSINLTWPMRIAVVDTNGDEAHELYIDSYKSDEWLRIHIKPNREQGGADQPATDPQSKSPEN